MNYPIRSLLAATDLGDGSDVILESAARLAGQIGAELHVVHSLELPGRIPEASLRKVNYYDRIDAAKQQLEEQVTRTMPEGVYPASRRVLIYAAHKAIRDCAREVSADVIVVGPHRGGSAGARFLGTTADRVIREAEVPCLVIRAPLARSLHRLGVPVDFSDPSRGALDVSLSGGMQVKGDAEEKRDDDLEVRVMHVGWGVEQSHPEGRERAVHHRLERWVEHAHSRGSGAEGIGITCEVLWAHNTADAVMRWADESAIDLLVIGTRGSSALGRVLLGSIASRIAREAPCSVLLVPSSLSLRPTTVPRLERTIIATDFSESSLEGARWSTRDFAPAAKHLLAHVLEIPDSPALFAGSYDSREQLLQVVWEEVRRRLEDLRTDLTGPELQTAEGVLEIEVLEGQPVDQLGTLAEDQDVDLIVTGDDGQYDTTPEGRTKPGTTVEQMVQAFSIPVLVVRGHPQGPPGTILVGVDGSAPSLRALSWADFLRRQFGASLTVLRVERPTIPRYSDLIPAGLEEPASGEQFTSWQSDWIQERELWLREEVRRSGIDPDSVSVRVRIGPVGDTIVAEQNRLDADLLILGTHGRGAVGRLFLGSVASKALRTASRSVLLVGHPTA